MNPVVNHIVEQLIEIRNGKLWMGDSFKKKLDSLDKSLVFTRPLPDLHSAAEILSHLTFWRTETLIKIKTGAGSITEESEDNWLPNKTLEKKGWDVLIEEYDQSLTDLINLLKEKNDTFLDDEYYDPDFKGTYPYRFLIDGMLHHDLYHLGQLGIVLKYLLIENSQK